MKKFQYSELSNNIKLLCSNVINTLSERTEEEIQKQLQSFKDFINEHSLQKKMVLGFIGQYNAGKSTIIAGLTNAYFERKYEEISEDGTRMVEIYKVGNKELKIGAQIMTDITEEYEWEDVLLLDTPGIHSGHPQHDSITLDQLSKCDLLVFVLPNELFNPEGGVFFRRIAFELKRKGQILLTVNKMTRETGTANALSQSILEVIEPGIIEDFYTSFIDADFYLKSLSEINTEEKEFLESQSHFSEFITSLEKLINKNKLTARLYTPLHRSVELVNNSLNILSNENKETGDLKEFYRRKILIIKASKTRLQNNVSTELNKLTFNIWKTGDGIAILCNGQHEISEIEKAFKESESKVQEASQNSFNQILQITQEEVGRLTLEFEDLTKSQLGKSIANELGIPVTARGEMGTLNVKDKNKIPDVLKKGPEVFSKLSGFASTISRDMVYNFVKFFGGKFKPWGAVKITKFLNKIGPVLGVVGTLLDIFFSIKEERDEKNYEKQLRDNRTEIRKNYSDIGNKMANDFENGWTDDDGTKHEGFNKVLFNDFYGTEIKSAEAEIVNLRVFDNSKKEFVSKLENILNEINKELEKINS